MLNSFYTPLCPVELPYAGRQRYMWGFDLADPVMEVGFEDYLEPVLALTRAAGALAGKAWMTVDEKIIQPGMSQRRPAPHVDGRFNMTTVAWGGNYPDPDPRWGHSSPPSRWGHGGGWNHSCNLIPTERTPIIVAASVAGCRAWEGQFDAVPSETGDLSHIQDQLGEGKILPANQGFLLSGDCVHESMVFEKETQRTFLRIALPEQAI